MPRRGQVERNGQLYDLETGRWLGASDGTGGLKQVLNGPEPTAPAAAAPPPPKEDDVVKPWHKMKKDEIKTYLDSADIEYGKSDTKGDLVQLAEVHLG